MTKPEFTKEFSIEHARAGAPYGTVGGAGLMCMCLNMRGERPIGGMIKEENYDFSTMWNENGASPYTENYSLVMLPLGVIEGKPVFVGDELDYEGRAQKDPLAKVGALDRAFGEFFWPAPVPAYPVTRMSGLELRAYFAEARDEMLSPCIAVANAAIARCFKDGDAVLRVEHEKVVGELFTQRNADSAYIDRLVAEGIAAGRAERDMAVAEKVARAVYDDAIMIPRVAFSSLGVDLPTIIATIK